MQRLERMRYITQYYDSLKGLTAVPFGLFFLLLATRDLGWTWLGEEGDCTYTLPLILLTFGGYYLANRYYARSFGTVTPLKKVDSFFFITAALVIFFVLIGLEFLLKPPVSLIGLFIAGYYIFDGLRSQRYYYLLFGISMVVVSLMPLLLGVPLSNRIFGSFGLVLKVVFGLAIIISGLIDHFRLVRAFQPFREDENV